MSEIVDVCEKESQASLEKEQQTRATLREKFLRCVSSIAGEHCHMKTVEYNDLSGYYHGIDIHVQNVFIKDLNTPYSNLKNGLVRTQDLLYMKFPNIEKSTKTKLESDTNEVSMD